MAGKPDLLPLRMVVPEVAEREAVAKEDGGERGSRKGRSRHPLLPNKMVVKWEGAQSFV